jgi:hypothetical protein
MHTEAPQKRTRMVSRSMPEGGIRITASPSQDGSTVNDEVTSSDESSSDGLQNNENKKGLMQRCPRSLAAFAML